MRVVSLFSGAGGLDLGFTMAGHEIVWANDIYEDAVKTYRQNLGDHIVCKDIALVDAAIFRIAISSLAASRVRAFRLPMSSAM